MRTILAGLAIVLVLLSDLGAARGAWVRPSELTYNTAHTLEAGQLEVGILSPLQYGVSERVQVGLHPILLLIGAPNLAVRWRVTPAREVTVSLDLSAWWSLLRRENELAIPQSDGCTNCGYPGQFQLTTTISWAVSRNVMLSVGTGPAFDFLDFEPYGVGAEVHGSLLWLITSDQLVMLHASGTFQIVGGQPQREPVVQLMYARACGTMHVGVGLAFGDFPIAREFDTSESWFVYPVLDLWWRI